MKPRTHSSRDRAPGLLLGALLGALLGPLLAAGCATSPQAMETEALLGCWYFDQDVTPRELRLPWGVRLAGGPVEGWPALQSLEDVRVAETLTSASARDFPIGYWRRTAEGDSLEMGYPAGGGLVVRVGVPQQGEDAPVLEGTVRAVGDAVEPGGQGAGSAEHGVRLTRARCP